MKLWKIALLLIGLSLIGFWYYISSWLVFWLSNEWDSDLYREKLWTTYLKGWKYPSRTVWTVQEWKIKIYKKHNVDLTTFLTLEAISQTECWDALWLCKSSTDVWPFQINSTKWSYYQDSLEYFNKKDYNSLFAFQVWRTLDNQKRTAHLCEWVNTIEDYVKCRAKIHNGNNQKACNWRERKHCYADRVRAMREILKKFYLHKY